MTTTMIKMVDIAWLAGLLEGDGCFGIYRKYPIIKLGMTSEDTVIRAASLMGSKVWHRKNMRETELGGTRAINLMVALYPFLGRRRREKVAEIIGFWRNLPASRAPNGTRSMATCHPDRFVQGLGLCSDCYNTHRRRRRLMFKKERFNKRKEGRRMLA